MENLKNKENNSGSFSAIGLAFNLGYLIVIPLVALAIGGRLLDKKLDSSPVLFLVGVVVSISISSFMVYSKTKQVMADIERATPTKKENNKQQ